MKEWTCERVRQWLTSARPVGETPAQNAALHAHIQECPTCERELNTYAAALLAVPVEALAQPCAASEADMAAYIDVEREEGMEMARQIFPHVWWHLISCAACAETYRLTQALVDSVEDGGLGPLPLAAPVQQAPAHTQDATPLQLRVTRRVLSQFLAVQQVLGVARGGSEEASVLAEVASERACLSVSIQQDASGRAALLVVVEPPLEGAAVVRFGEATFRTPLDAHGRALFADVPASLLAAVSGPDVEISIE